MKWLVLAFIVIPTSELFLLMYSGKELGVVPTIALILLTGIGGAYLAKRQGIKAWTNFNNRMSKMEAPGIALIDSVCILIAGILLLIPGFITDALGLLLLFNGTRKLIRPIILKWIYKKMKNGRIVMK